MSRGKRIPYPMVHDETVPNVGQKWYTYGPNNMECHGDYDSETTDVRAAVYPYRCSTVGFQ